MALNKKSIVLIGAVVIVVGIAVYGLRGNLGSGALSFQPALTPLISAPKIARTTTPIDTNIIRNWQDVNGFRITNMASENISITFIQMACGGSGAIHAVDMLDNDMELWANGSRIAVTTGEPCNTGRIFNLASPVVIGPKAFKDFKVRFFTGGSGWLDGDDLNVYVSQVRWRGAKEGGVRTDVVDAPLMGPLLYYRKS